MRFEDLPVPEKYSPFGGHPYLPKLETIHEMRWDNFRIGLNNNTCYCIDYKVQDEMSQSLLWRRGILNNFIKGSVIEDITKPKRFRG